MSNAEGLRMRRIAGAVFVAAALAFLGIFVARDFDRLLAYPWQIQPSRMLLSVMVNIAGLVWGVATWKMLLRLQGYAVPLPRLSRIWFVSGLGRYIPGKIWQFVGAAHLAKSGGLPALVTVTSLAAHTFIFLLAAVLVSLYLVPAAVLGWPPETVQILRILAPFCLLAVHPAVIRKVLAIAQRLSGREVGEWKGTWAGTIIILVMAVFSWFITGIGLYLFLQSLTPLSPGYLPDIVAFNAFAFLAGYLVFITPAGLGAKDGVLAALLALIVPVSVAALLALAARFWSIVGEVLPALFFLRKGGVAAGESDAFGSPEDPIAVASKRTHD